MKFQELNQFLEEKINADEFSGVILVARAGKMVFDYSAGYANKDKSILNRLDTKFNIGSINKMFTGVAITQLVEKGVLSFDDTVGEYLQDYPNQTVRNEVTIHHLLTHTSGLGSFIDTKYLSEYLEARESLNTIDSVIEMFKNRELEGPVGEFHYSSDGYELLGAIIEKITGTSYYDYMRVNIFKAANMLNTDNYEIDLRNPREDIAIGYTYIDYKTGKKLVNRTENWGRLPLKGTASGAGYSTAPDLLNFSKALLNNKLLSEKMVKTLLSPQEGADTSSPIRKSSAYGFAIFEGGGYKRVGHAGQFDGVCARFDIYPNLNYVVIVLSNYDAPAAFEVAQKVGRILYKASTK